MYGQRPRLALLIVILAAPRADAAFHAQRGADMHHEQTGVPEPRSPIAAPPQGGRIPGCVTIRRIMASRFLGRGPGRSWAASPCRAKGGGPRRGGERGPRARSGPGGGGRLRPFRETYPHLGLVCDHP